MRKGVLACFVCSVLFVAVAPAHPESSRTTTSKKAPHSYNQPGAIKQKPSASRVSGDPYGGKVPKSCTYRGGPKSGVWACR